jgi:carbamate kinase
MRIVVALGGNALLRRGQALTDANQRANVRSAAAAIAPLCNAGNEIVITHGNGPQVGLLALQSAAGPPDAQQPLDVLNAESEGMLGYLIALELRNALAVNREVVSILSQVSVDPNDPAFVHPTKPIGPVYPEPEARRMAAKHGWTIVEEPGGWRRSVASPKPVSVSDTAAIACLIANGFVVICIGGGGIPVVLTADGRLEGVEAVIDKDRASGLLARELGADCLMLLTDVDAVYLDWQTAEQRAIASAGPDDFDLPSFEEGSMRPKVEAAIAFVRETGNRAVIGRLEDVEDLLAARAGTLIENVQSGIRMRR